MKKFFKIPFAKYEIELLKLNLFLTCLACAVTYLFYDFLLTTAILISLICFNIFLIVTIHWHVYERKT